MDKPASALRLLLGACLLALLGSSCAGRSAVLLQAAPLPPRLPALPAEDGDYAPARRASDGSLPLGVTAPSAQSGAFNRTEGGSYVVSAAAGELAWAQYSLAGVTAERPLALAFGASAAPQQAGGGELPLEFYVGVANYTLYRWEWHGPYGAGDTIVLHTPDSGSAPQRRARYVSASGNFHVLLATRGEAGAGGAALRLDALTLNTTDAAQQLQPHFPQLAGASYSAGQIDLTWQHVAAFDANDAPNTATTYTIFRRGPFDTEFQQIGSVAAPQAAYSDVSGAAAGVEALLPGGTYSYRISAGNAAGTAPLSEVRSCSVALDTANTAWSNSHADPARSGYLPGESVSGPLEADWSMPLSFPTTTNRYREPVTKADGSVYFVDRTAVRSFQAGTGSEGSPLDSFDSNWFAQPSLFDGRLAFCREDTGVRLVDLAAPANSTGYDGLARARSAPLLLGYRLLWADELGLVNVLDIRTGEIQWQYGSNPSAPYYLAPATDMEFVYVAKNNGLLEKLRLDTGELAGSYTLPDGNVPRGESLVLDPGRHRLYLATQDFPLVALDTATMTLADTLAPASGGGFAMTPCVLWNAVPPLVVTAYAYNAPPVSNPFTRVVALNADTFDEEWTTDLVQWGQSGSISACSNAIFVVKAPKTSDASSNCNLSTLDLQGNVVQELPVAGYFLSPAVPVQGKVLLVQDGDNKCLSAYKPLAVTPPDWLDPDEFGLRDAQRPSLPSNPADLKLQWWRAVHPDSLTVEYAVFCSDGQPPEFEAPFTHTTVISGLTWADEGDYILSGLTPGHHYYIGMRAYVGTWGAGAATTSNTNWLTVTPPWIRKGLAQTSIFDGLNDPGKEIDRMLLVPATGLPGYLSLVQSNRDTGVLGLNFGNQYSFGADGLIEFGSFTSDGFGAAWDSKLFIANADQGQFTILRRDGLNSWDYATTLAGPVPDGNPAVALALSGGKGVLGYTEFISGSAPATVVHYYAARNTGSGWGAKEAVDAANLGGRDIAAGLDPADADKPWLAYQRGTEAATAMAGCTKGQLWFARGDGLGGYALELVDAGENGASSDCGKRVRMLIDSAGHPHLAYYDLNASDTEPRGRLKYAYHDGTQWTIENVRSFDLSAQGGESQHTYCEIGFMLDAAGQPVFGFLERLGYNTDLSTPYGINSWCIHRTGADTYDSEWVADTELVYLKDREPCGLFLDADGNWRMYYVCGDDFGARVGRKIRKLVRGNS